MAEILVSDFTNATTVVDGQSNGTGVLDKLMNTINLYLDDQYSRNRLKGTDYAQVLVSSVTSAIQTAANFTLNKKVSEAQIDLYNRQKEGFSDDAKQKLVKIVLDSWGIAYSTAPDSNAIPDAITKRTIDKLVENAMISLSITEQNDLGNYNAIDNAYLERGQAV